MPEKENKKDSLRELKRFDSFLQLLTAVDSLLIHDSWLIAYPLQHAHNSWWQLAVTADDSLLVTADDSLPMTADDSLPVTVDDSFPMTAFPW